MMNLTFGLGSWFAGFSLGRVSEDPEGEEEPPGDGAQVGSSEVAPEPDPVKLGIGFAFPHKPSGE